MIDKLGFKDFSEESVRAIDLTSFKQLVTALDYNKLEILGPNTASQFMVYIDILIHNPIEDFKIMSALSFDGMADEKWKMILKSYTINEIVSMNNDQLYESLTKISGIGPKVVQAIINGKDLYSEDIDYILNTISIINSKGKTDRPKVAFTGFRDQEYTQILIDNGFDANDKYGVTKSTAALIADDINSNSSKIQTARKYGIPIYTKQSFLEKNNINLQ